MKTNILVLLLLLLFASISNAQTKIRPEQLIAQLSQYEKIRIEDKNTLNLERQSRRLLSLVYSRKDLFLPQSIKAVTLEAMQKKYIDPVFSDAREIRHGFAQDFTGEAYEIVFKLLPSNSDRIEITERQSESFDEASKLLSDYCEKTSADNAFKWSGGYSLYIKNAFLYVIVFSNLTPIKEKYREDIMFVFPLYLLEATDAPRNGTYGSTLPTGKYHRTRGFMQVEIPKGKVKKTVVISLVSATETIPAAVIPAVKKKDVVVHSLSDATVYTSKPIMVSIGDIQTYDHDSVSVWLTKDGKISKTDKFEITLADWKQFTVSPGSLIAVNAISEGRVPPCTIGVRLSNGKSFSLQSKKGEQMKIQVEQEE